MIPCIHNNNTYVLMIFYKCETYQLRREKGEGEAERCKKNPRSLFIRLVV